MNGFFGQWEERLVPWCRQPGPEGDVVLATTAGLARNLRTFPFPGAATDVEKRTVSGELFRQFKSLPRLDGGWFLELESLGPTQRRCLAEMNLISGPAVDRPLGRGLALDRALGLALATNLDDHLLATALLPGFAPLQALASVQALESDLEDKVEFAFSPDFGYLASCPTRVGTGLRLNALMHLPGLVLAGEIEKLINALRQLQFSVGGYSGQGSTVRGALFQVCNLITLGRSEAEICEDFATHVRKIIAYERAARRQLVERDRLGLEDMALRSLAVLQQARLMSSQEAFDRLSNVRLGASLGLVPGLEPEFLDRILVRQQSGHLDHEAGRFLQGRDKLAARADFCRLWFAGPAGRAPSAGPHQG